MSHNDCLNYHEDGSGHYCKAVDMRQLKEAGRVPDDYPHKYWRVLCFNDLSTCMFRPLYTKKEA